MRTSQGKNTKLNLRARRALVTGASLWFVYALVKSPIGEGRGLEVGIALGGLLIGALFGSRIGRRPRRAPDAQHEQICAAMNASSIIAVIDARGRITEANDNFCRASGYAREELIGRDHRILSSLMNTPEFFSRLDAHVSSGRAWTGDVVNRRKDGRTYHLRTVVTPIVDARGAIERYLTVCHDVTEQKNLDDVYAEAQSLAKTGSWRYDAGNLAQTWSPEIYRIFELSELVVDSDLNQACADRIHPADFQPFVALFLKSFEAGTDYTADMRLVFDGGRRIKYVRSIGKIIKNEAGISVGFRGFCQDLTEFVELQAQNKYILEAMGIGTWTYNPAKQELLWDRSLNGVYDMTPDGFPSHYEAWASLLTDEARAAVLREIESAVRGDSDFDTTYEITTKSGQKKHIAGRGVVVRTDDGQPFMMYGINWDRTREVSLEASLQRERVKSLLNAKLASLGEMSAGIAHEINNPLALIVGNLQLLRRLTAGNEAVIGRLDVIAKSAGRIEKIVKGLKKFSRSSEGAEHRVECLNSLLTESLTITDAKLRRHGMVVTTEIAEGLAISCDAVEIEQVLVNLINNGIDAVKDEADRWIKITGFADEGDGTVVLRVIDSGSGITDETEKKLFQPFFTTKPVGEGTGLGLSITKGILDTHRATFTLNRTFATTCFEIRFPRAEVPADVSHRAG